MNENIAELNAQIEELKKEIAHERQREVNYTVGRDMGEGISGMMSGLTDSGIPEDFVREIVLLVIESSMSR